MGKLIQGQGERRGSAGWVLGCDVGKARYREAGLLRECWPVKGEEVGKVR